MVIKKKDEKRFVKIEDKLANLINHYGECLFENEELMDDISKFYPYNLEKIENKKKHF